MFQAEIGSGEDDGEVLAPEQHRARMFAKRTQSLSVFHTHTYSLQETEAEIRVCFKNYNHRSQIPVLITMWKI